MPNDPRVENLRQWWLAVSRKDLDALDHLADEIFTPDCIEHNPDILGVEPGPLGHRKMVEGILRRNPDAHVDVDDMFVDGNYVITRATVKGNDPASGKPIDLVMLAVDRFAGDQIAEEWQIVTPGKW